MRFNNRIGEISVNKFGTKMMIIKYINCEDIIVEFQDEYKYKVHTNYGAFKNGKVKNVYDRTFYGVGFLGDGCYNKTQHTKIYNSWCNMLCRCYMEPCHPAYIDCSVDEYFHNFQNFGKWFDDNYYTVDNETMCLDKDIKKRHNKIYSPTTCIFVPERLNKLFVRNKYKRGNLPIGVGQYKHTSRFIVKCNILDEYCKQKSICLGCFDDVDDAFIAYKHFKESYIKSVVKDYKNKIPKEIYDMIYNYEVKIDD